MKMRSVLPMWIAKIGYIAVSVVLFAFGVLFITLPDISVEAIGTMLGAAMVVYGCVRLVGYFSKDLFRLAFQYDLQFGILIFVLGLIMLLKPHEALNMLFMAMGIAVLADSLFRIQTALDARRFGIKKWWAIVALAVVCAVMSAVLVIKPDESAASLVVLLGAALIAVAILNMLIAVITVKIVKHQYPDNIEADYFETEDKHR